MAIHKVLELVGTSESSWEDAVQRVVNAAAGSVRHIDRVEVLRQCARVDGGRITSFEATVQLSFEVESHSHILGVPESR